MASECPNTGQVDSATGGVERFAPKEFLDPLSSQDRVEVEGLDVELAVDRLQARERSEPDPRRVVTLRNLRIAAGQLARATAPMEQDPMPATSSDRVDLEHTAEGVPVVTPGALTLGALSEALRTRGCLLVRRAISRKRANERRQAIDRAIELADAAAPPSDWLCVPPKVAGQPVSPISRIWTRREGGSLAVDSPRILEDVIEDYRSAGVVAVAEEFVRERPALAAEKCYVRRFPAEGLRDNGWHQDGAFIGTPRVLNGWMTFTDCGKFAPGMELLLRRVDEIHTSDGQSDFSWSLSDRQVRALADDPAEIVAPEFEAGDCLLFDHMFVHRTHRGVDSTNPRSSAETWFFAPSTMKDEYVPVLV